MLLHTETFAYLICFHPTEDEANMIVDFFKWHHLVADLSHIHHSVHSVMLSWSMPFSFVWFYLQDISDSFPVGMSQSDFFSPDNYCQSVDTDTEY